MSSARPGAKRRLLADGSGGGFARAALARQAAEDAYEFSSAEERPPTRARRRSPPEKGAAGQKQFSGRRSGAGRGGRQLSPKSSSSPPNPAAKKRRKAAKCLHGVTCYCMIADKPLKERLQSVIKQLGGKLVKKWHDANNHPASVVIISTKNVELPPPGKAWRDERVGKATIVSSEWVDQCETQRRKVDAAPFVPEILNAPPEELEAQPDEPDELGGERDVDQRGRLERTQQQEREREQEEMEQEEQEQEEQEEQEQARTATSRQHEGGGGDRGWQGVQDSSIAGSLGFELTSQASPAPRAVTSDEEDNGGGARAVQLRQPSPPEESQEEPLHLVYEETQKQEESDSEGGVAAVPAVSSSTGKTARMDAPAPVADTEAAVARVLQEQQRPRSKLSERMKDVSREIEEEERAEAEAEAEAEAAKAKAKAAAIKAAAEAADAAAVEAAQAEAAKAEAAAAIREAAASQAAAAKSDASIGDSAGGPHIVSELQVSAAGAHRVGSQSNALDSEPLESEKHPDAQRAAATTADAASGVLEAPAAAAAAGPRVGGDEAGGCSNMATVEEHQEEDIIVPSSQPPESQLSCGFTGEATAGGTAVVVTGAASPPSVESAGSVSATTAADVPSEPARQAALHGSVDAVKVGMGVTAGATAALKLGSSLASSADHASVLVHDSSDEEGNAEQSAATGDAANQCQQASAAVAPAPSAAALPARISPAAGPQKVTQRNRRSGQTSVAEDAGWRDPTVRAQLVLRPGQAIDKWSSAPAVVRIRNDITTFGRFESNDVVLSNTVNHQISREGHARIYLPSFTSAEPAAGGGAMHPIGPNDQAEIEDGQSRNGIFVNNVKVERAALRNGDTVTFGGGDEMACGQQLPKELQAGLTLTYIFRMRGLGHRLHILYVAMEGNESSPIGLVRLQGRHTMADLRQIISQELDNPPPDGSYVFLHRMAAAAAAAVPVFGGDRRAAAAAAPVSSKQEAGLAAAAALPLVVLRPRR